MKAFINKNNEKKKSEGTIKKDKEKKAIQYNLDHQISVKEDFIDKKNKKLLPSLYAKKDELNDKTAEVKTANGDITIGVDKKEKKATIVFTKKQNKYINITNSRDEQVIDNSSSVYRQDTDNLLFQNNNEAVGIRFEKNKNYKKLKENIKRVKKTHEEIALNTMDMFSPEIDSQNILNSQSYYKQKIDDRNKYIEKKVNKAMDKIKLEIDNTNFDDFPELMKKRLLEAIEEIKDTDEENSEED